MKLEWNDKVALFGSLALLLGTLCDCYQTRQRIKKAEQERSEAETDTDET